MNPLNDRPPHKGYPGDHRVPLPDPGASRAHRNYLMTPERRILLAYMHSTGAIPVVRMSPELRP